MPSQRQSKRRSKDEAAGRKEKKRFHPSAPTSLWSGTITFGLVSLPVNLYPANRPKPVSLRMVDRDGTPLTRCYFCEKEERALDNDELVRGYEIGKNEFVVIEDRELDSLAPEKSREIDLKRFVGVDEIDPMYFERAYLMTPDRGATKAYRLLAESMEASGRAGIATFVMRGKEYLVAIIAEKGILRAETLRFAEEIRSPEEIGLPRERAPDKRRVKAMEKAIAALSRETFEREALQDLQSQRIIERAEEKLARGQDVVPLEEQAQESGAEPERGGEVIDLMQVLKQSLAEGRSPGQQERKGGRPDRGRRAAPKPDGKSAQRGKRRRAELERLSRDQLYERARKLDVPGRSRMNKAELVEAIAAQQTQYS
ncbi:non-homologous end joining protein Ku [Microbulbifer sp.]|uniref:non-homologous end joining protein Ku n=1 Tax=Microbulbifer sp. TaxID=1908541 RepID=UPI003F3E577D